MSTWQAVRAYLSQRAEQFAAHRFFEELAHAPAGQALSFAPRLTFWAMTFQDVLRLNEERVKDPKARKLIKHHRSEDAHHDRWLLSDLDVLGMGQPDAARLYSRDHESTREAAYALMSEVFQDVDDRLRVLLVLCLEATGHVFFERVSRATAAAGLSKRLRYFSEYHLAVEKAHELVEQRIEDEFFSGEAPEHLCQQGMALIDRVVAAFERMFEGLCQPTPTLTAIAPEQPSLDPVVSSENAWAPPPRSKGALG